VKNDKENGPEDCVDESEGGEARLNDDGQERSCADRRKFA